MRYHCATSALPALLRARRLYRMRLKMANRRGACDATGEPSAFRIRDTLVAVRFRAIGAVGSALPSHGRGHRFESGIAHREERRATGCSDDRDHAPTRDAMPDAPSVAYWYRLAMVTRRALTPPAIFLMVAGVFELLGFITYFIDLPVYHWNWWTYFISDIALLVGLVLLGRALRGIAQWFLYAGALGWLLVVIWILVPFGALSTIGQWLGCLGALAGAIVILVQARLPRPAAVALLVATALLALLYLLPVPDMVALVGSLLISIALIATGGLILRRKG